MHMYQAACAPGSSFPQCPSPPLTQMFYSLVAQKLSFLVERKEIQQYPGELFLVLGQGRVVSSEEHSTGSVSPILRTALEMLPRIQQSMGLASFTCQEARDSCLLHPGLSLGAAASAAHNWAWWCQPVTPALREAEAAGWVRDPGKGEGRDRPPCLWDRCTAPGGQQGQSQHCEVCEPSSHGLLGFLVYNFLGLC